MEPSVGSEANSLRRPLLDESSGVDEKSCGPTRPTLKTSEKQDQTYDEANPHPERETDNILTAEGGSSWDQPPRYPRLERQRGTPAENLYAVQLTTGAAECQHSDNISAYRKRFAAVERLSNFPHWTATSNQQAGSTCEASFLPNPSRVSSTAYLPCTQHHHATHGSASSAVSALYQLPHDQTRLPAPNQSPPPLVMTAGNLSTGDPGHGILPQLCVCTCLSRAQRTGRKVLRTFGDCSTAFWWSLSPLFLLFTWFCWHGIHALWKVRSRGPGHWFSPGDEGIIHDYGLVIDAGSHGSRLSIYSWKPRLFDPSHPFTGPVSFPKLRFRGIPQDALTSPIQVPSVLGALIDQATEFLHVHARIPELRWSDFPIYLKATGGMRNMDQARRDILMESIRDYLEPRKNNPFHFKRSWARVLAGEEEGVYGWLAVNNGRNSLIDDPARTTGALDLGGASAQITFFPTHTSVLEDLTLVRLGDRTIRLYSHSYLGYGWSDALSRVSAGLAVEALLQRIKTNPKFIAENARTAHPLVTSADTENVAAENNITLHGDSRIFALGVQHPYTSQKATSSLIPVHNFSDKNSDSIHLRRARGARRLPVKVVNNQNEVNTSEATEDSGNNFVIEIDAEGGKAEFMEYDEKPVAGRRSRVGRKKRKTEKERTQISNQEKRRGSPPLQRLDEPGEQELSLLGCQSEGTRDKRNTHMADSSFFNGKSTNGSLKIDETLGELPEKTLHDTTSPYVTKQQDTHTWKEVDGEKEAGISNERSQKRISSSTVAANLPLHGEHEKKNELPNHANTENSQALPKKGEIQYDTTFFPQARRKVDAVAGNEWRNTISGNPNKGRHKSDTEAFLPNEKGDALQALVSIPSEEGSVTTKLSYGNEDAVEHISERKENKVDNKEDGKRDVVDTTRQERRDKNEMTSEDRENNPLKETFTPLYELIFPVEHPCFPRGVVSNFYLPPMTYPDRRYYIDIARSNVEAYMWAAGYTEQTIRKILKTMYPHLADIPSEATSESTFSIISSHTQDVEQTPEKNSSNIFLNAGEISVPQSSSRNSELSKMEKIDSRNKSREKQQLLLEQASRTRMLSQLQQASGKDMRTTRKRRTRDDNEDDRNSKKITEKSSSEVNAYDTKTITNNPEKTKSSSSFNATPSSAVSTAGEVHSSLFLNTITASSSSSVNSTEEKSNPSSSSSSSSFRLPSASPSVSNVSKINTSSASSVFDASSSSFPSPVVTVASVHEKKNNTQKDIPAPEDNKDLDLQQQNTLRDNLSADKHVDIASTILLLDTRKSSAGNANMNKKQMKDERPTRGEKTQYSTLTKEEGKKSILRNPKKVDEKNYSPTTTKPKIQFIARFLGTGDFDACRARATKLFYTSLCFLNNCAFNGVYQPRLENSNFLAFGQYSKVHAALHLPPKAPLSAFLEETRIVCEKHYRELQMNRRLRGFSAFVYSKKATEKLCWKAIWAYTMLHEGFGFPSSSNRISFAPVAGDDHADGPVPEWATGSMIAEVNSYPWEVPPETYEGPFHLATAFLLLSVLLAIIFYHEIHWMRMRLRERQHCYQPPDHI